MSNAGSKAIIDKLAEWGCDTVSALERTLGDAEFYIDCLKIFTRDAEFDNLGKALEKEKCESAFNSAHQLKGVAANLGLTPVLYDISNEVELLRCETPNLDKARQIYEKVLQWRGLLEECLREYT